ncbi:MAG TPA: SsrA-binding protein SmpB [Kofleriaceae bacterium]|nr:SsrA-binding protein SmpB [Kofleriaceae bacterium]
MAKGAAKNDANRIKILVRNRRALHDYAIDERIEAGIALVGSEVKSLRGSRASLAEGYVIIDGGQAWLMNVQISEYPWASQQNHEPTRRRKLLLHRREIRKLDTRVAQRGLAMVPLSIYLKEGKIKVEIGIGKGKRFFEKRESQKAVDAARDIDQALRSDRAGRHRHD